MPRILKKHSSKERQLVCCRCGKTNVYEPENDVVQAEDGLCYIICANKRCAASNYIGTIDVLTPRRRTPRYAL